MKCLVSLGPMASARLTIKILIIGGYGTFGGRIVELLERESRLILIVAGRSLGRAAEFCQGRTTARAELVPAALDRDGELGAQLSALRPDIVVDASGPFQAYGPAPYRLVEACLACGVNYLDLADGAGFVAGIDAFDAQARAKGNFVLSGVSSFPVLTAAVVERLAQGLVRLDTIRGGIAPSPYAGVGLNVIRAIAGYAGQPVPLRRDGRTALGYPLTEQIRYTIAPPGVRPLHNTLFSLVDVPDLIALAKLWPEAKDIWMGAGPVPELLHRALASLAWMVRLKLLGSVLPFASLMHWATNRLGWGEHRGGMFVAVAGIDDRNEPVSRSWHMIADGGDGPLIPSMAVQALVLKMLDGHVPSPGARAAANELDLADYERLFAGRAIHCGIRMEADQSGGSLYGNLLGPVFAALPPEIQRMHEVHKLLRAEGRASVERGRNVLARLAAAMVGFPRAASDIPVAVKFECAGGVETWTRTFDGRSFSSRQFAGQGRSGRLLCETFGPLTFAMALVVDDGRLSLVLRRWCAFGVPLPLWLAPRSTACEVSQDGRFHFHIEIGHPLTGLIVRYRGWLVPVQAAV